MIKAWLYKGEKKLFPGGQVFSSKKKKVRKHGNLERLGEILFFQIQKYVKSGRIASIRARSSLMLYKFNVPISLYS